MRKKMLSYADVQASVRAILFGTNESKGPALVPVKAVIERPEGRRRYLIAVSPNGVPGKKALVIVLHGAGASAEQVLGLAFPPSPLSLWLEIAEREHSVVIAPDAGKGGWSDCFASSVRVARKNDVAFVEALIEHAIATHGVDPNRVYVMGVSRGGWMAYRMAIEIPHRLAAFSVVLAGMPPPGRGKMPMSPLPALIFGCTADPLIRYHGGKPWYALRFAEPVRSIENTVQAWRELAQLPDKPNVLRIAKHDPQARTAVTRFMWGEAPEELQVGLYRIEGAGHAEPSRLKRYPRFINWLTGLQNADLEVAEAAWDFFHPKKLNARGSDFAETKRCTKTGPQWVESRLSR
ncbi:alpha/beta hydrolase family esterase [Massilia niabensis]|uniref:Alpha/beta hydrolase family esterase n=1 Tax=Massilia niabensis TaxID=544910 RepID=A0ABW0L9Z9_9BURK